MGELIGWLGLLGAGLFVTAQLSLGACVLSIPLAAMLAVFNISPWKPLRVAARIWVDFFRSVPLLAVLMFVYYGLGGLASQLNIPALVLAIASLTVSESAYLSEVYRGTLRSISRSQWEAASSLGLSWVGALRFVVLPQAVLPSIPNTLNAVIYMIKDSSLASLVAVNEVTLAATLLVSRTFEPMQVYVVLAALYLAIIIPLSLLSQRIEAFTNRSIGEGTRRGVRRAEVVTETVQRGST